jgi:hypothetical protein
MENIDQNITDIRVLDIAEEGAKVIETIVNKYGQGDQPTGYSHN